MAHALFQRNHIATTPDEKAIERGFASSVGLLAGLGLAILATLLAGLQNASIPGIVMLFLTSAPLGIIAANKLLTTESTKTPVLEMMRYTLVTLPTIMLVETFFGGQGLALLGDFVGSLAMSGPRLVFSLVAAATVHALMCRVVWDDEDRASERERPSPSVDWQGRYVEARARLAHTTVDLRQRRASEEEALAAFDRKLAAAYQPGEEWVMETETTEAAAGREVGEDAEQSQSMMQQA